jgi:hypothetical protein
VVAEVVVVEVIAKFEKTTTYTAHNDDKETVLISTEYVSGCLLVLLDCCGGGDGGCQV